MLFDFTLTGRTPLLVHADDVERSDHLKEWREDSKNAAGRKPGDDRSPPWSWQTCVYGDGKQLTMPSDLVMASLRVAGAKVPLKKGSYKALTQSGLFIPTEHCELAGPKGPIRQADLDKIRSLPFAEQAEAVQGLGFSLFAKRSRVGQAKHVRVRPRFDAWVVKGSIEIIDAEIRPAKLLEIFEVAGDKAGLGDWRPSSPKSPGPYGRFSVALTPAA